MITPGADLKVYVATRPVDFRKGHDGLAALVQQMFGLDPFSGAAFVFRAKRADRVKILVWDRTGMVLVHKRLEGCKFAGHEIGAENWALLSSIVATCRLNDVNPVAYLADTLTAIIDGHPQSQIEDLMPWRFRKASTPSP